MCGTFGCADELTLIIFFFVRRSEKEDKITIAIYFFVRGCTFSKLKMQIIEFIIVYFTKLCTQPLFETVSNVGTRSHTRIASNEFLPN